MPRIALVTAAAVLCAAMPTRTQQMDMEVMMRWSSAKVVGYRIVGVYEGRVNVVGGSKWIGYADVTDRVEIELAWPETEEAGLAHRSLDASGQIGVARVEIPT